MLLGQVVKLGAIGLQIVQLPGAAGALGDELPLAVADRAIALVFPEDRLRAAQWLAAERWTETDALHRRDGLAVEFLRVGRPGTIDAGGH